MTRPLFSLAGRLACLGVTRVVMEATPDYWKPVFYLREAAGFETWLVNAKDVRYLPGRPKTGKLDAVWLCKVVYILTRFRHSRARSVPDPAGTRALWRSLADSVTHGKRGPKPIVGLVDLIS